MLYLVAIINELDAAQLLRVGKKALCMGSGWLGLQKIATNFDNLLTTAARRSPNIKHSQDKHDNVTCVDIGFSPRQ